MSLYGTIYNGTTGLITYSKGLDVISNNVANMNTPGFKRNDMLFRDLFYHYQLRGEFSQNFSSHKDGNGVTEAGTTTSFVQGEIQQSGNDTDVAIEGNGLFILRSDTSIYYSRVGQFQVDEDGYLVSSINEARVAGINDKGELVDINISELRTSPAKATSEVSFVNELLRTTEEHVVESIEVFDSQGRSHDLSLTLTKNDAVDFSWFAEIKDENDETIAKDLEIRFQGDGTPAEDFNAFTFTFHPEGADTNDITFFFGEPGSSSGVFLSSATRMAVEKQDGLPPGSQISLEFTRDGVLEIRYSNNETAEGGRLALAWLNNPQSLKQIGQGLFELGDGQTLQLEAANEGIMGEISGGSIEISNVELSQEFTDLVIIQRGFQVSSQVVSIANEMIQQLMDSTQGRR